MQDLVILKKSSCYSATSQLIKDLKIKSVKFEVEANKHNLRI